MKCLYLAIMRLDPTGKGPCGDRVPLATVSR